MVGTLNKEHLMETAATSSVTEQTDIPEIARDVPQGLELGLRNYWYPVIESGKVVADQPTGFTMLGEALVAWRDNAGRPCVVRRCWVSTRSTCSSICSTWSRKRSTR